jgi:hypothetical protein
MFFLSESGKEPIVYCYDDGPDIFDELRNSTTAMPEELDTFSDLPESLIAYKRNIEAPAKRVKNLTYGIDNNWLLPTQQSVWRARSAKFVKS